MYILINRDDIKVVLLIVKIVRENKDYIKNVKVLTNRTKRTNREPVQMVFL